jgi:hypothetical protein
MYESKQEHGAGTTILVRGVLSAEAYAIEFAARA